ncbi:MAG: hypothetical protein ACI8RZ_003169 [Myxococcota bacterium]|jgi:hypothetical protein
MGATRDFVAATFTDAFLPAFRRPVEDIIYETLDRRQIPTRTDFKEMRDLLNTLRGQISGATNGVKKLVDRLTGTEDRLGDLEDRIDAIEARLDSLEAAGKPSAPAPQAPAGITEAQLEARLTAFTEGLKAAAPAAPQPAVITAPARREDCKVHDCDDPGRARGFCARHYQKWRRGTLAGFVSLEGDVTVGGETIKLEGLSGEAYTTDGGKILVNGQVVG